MTPNISQKSSQLNLRCVGVGVLFLLPVAMLSSLAATEALSWLFFLVCVLVFVDRLRLGSGFREELLMLRLGAEIPLWGYLVITLVSLLVNVDDLEEVRSVAGSHRWVLLLYAYTYFFRLHLKESWKRYVPILACCLLALGIYSILQFLFGFEPPRSRSISFPRNGYWQAVGFFSLPLTFAGVIGYVSFMLSAFLITGDQLLQLRANLLRSLPVVLGSVLGFAGVLVSLTRGAWLAFAGALVIGAGIVRLKLAAAAFAALIGFVGLAYVSNAGIQKRFDSIFSTRARSNNLRWLIWAANIEMIKDYPLLGVGTEQNDQFLDVYFPKLGAANETFRGHAHNNLLQVWAGQGTLALIFYLWFSGFFILRSVQVYRFSSQGSLANAIGLGCFSAQIYFHLSGMTECNFIDGEVNHVLVFSWGLLSSAYLYEGGQRTKRISLD